MLVIDVRAVIIAEDYNHGDLRDIFLHIKNDLNQLSKKEIRRREHYMVMDYHIGELTYPEKTLTISDGLLSVSVQLTSRINDLWDYAEENIPYDYLVINSIVLNRDDNLDKVDKIVKIPLPERLKIVVYDRSTNIHPAYYISLARWASITSKMISDNKLNRMINKEFHILYGDGFRSVRFNSIRKVSRLIGYETMSDLFKRKEKEVIV